MVSRCVVALAAAGAFAGRAQAADVLVVHSYERDLTWTEGQHAGLLAALEPSGPHRFFVEHLDAKRFDPRELEADWTRLLRTKYADRTPDVIVTTDDPARRLVTGLHPSLFADVPVVFSGADHLEPRDVAAQRGWMTGVSENSEPGETVAVVSQIRPETRRIWILADRTEMGEGNAGSARAVEADLPAHVQLEFIRDTTWPELERRLRAAPSEVSVVWMHFVVDGSGRRETVTNAIDRVVAASAAPVFASWDFSLGSGAVGGWITSGRDQGRLAGELVNRILEGEPTSAIPIVTEGGNRWIFGWEGLRRFGIRRGRLPRDATVVGRPESMWDVYAVEISALLAVLAILSLSTAFLAISDQGRRRSLIRLREMSDRFQAFFEALPFGVLIAEDGPKGPRVVAANPAARRLRMGALEGRALAEVIPGEVIRGPMEWNEQQEGEERTFDGRGFQLRSNEHVVVFQDITRKRGLERELVEAQKREAVGRLAAGVAHDLNNILQCIFSSTRFILDTDPPAQVRDDVELVANSAQRAAALTTQLLGFVRKNEAQPRTVDLGELLRPFCGLLRRVMGEPFDLVLELSEPAPHAHVDPGQLEQVILNLALNARDAMPQGGRLRISARREAETVRIEVEDEGLGMDDATRARIFEPFFTTKGPERGTGLGLSMVKEIVEAQGGQVEVCSKVGAGSRFVLILPAAEPKKAPDASLVRPRRPSGQGRVVLVVEDDGSVRRTTRRALEYAGYQVVEAADIESAREIFARERVDVLFTDVVLPDGSGRGLAERLQGESPSLRVVLTSGYDPDETSWSEEILRKPFAIDELISRIQSSEGPMS